LYERTHRLVFTLIMRIVSNRETAEELTLDVFHDVWRRASGYPAENGTVVGWVMNLARSRAIVQAADSRDVLEIERQNRALRGALAVLTLDERHAIEAGLLFELTHLGTVKTRIRSGLHKLHQVLAAEASKPSAIPCSQAELVCAYAVHALSPSEASMVEAHLSWCAQCGQELATLRPIIDSFVSWPTDVLRPAASLRERLARRISAQTGARPVLPAVRPWSEPEWEDVAPGISCKLLSSDTQKHVVSMLVRLAPRAEYPPHTHAGVEELHLLDGELWIDERKLYPGDFNRAVPGTGDKRVWTETGCTCVLITSTKDVLT
jgi:anti-sigma factor ChrR (cupin superfamily)/DNA-directed RNA polymerase specialized sigma24 family protein